MKKLILIAGFALTAFAADVKPLTPGRKVFIDKMPQDLDSYIKAEFSKQHIPLIVVADAEGADYILTGTSTEEERRKWHEGWLTAERDKTAGSVQILDTKSKAMLWAGEAGDRSLMWGSMARGGHRKVAARLVDNLKKAIAKP